MNLVDSQKKMTTGLLTNKYTKGMAGDNSSTLYLLPS